MDLPMFLYKVKLNTDIIIYDFDNKDKQMLCFNLDMSINLSERIKELFGCEMYELHITCISSEKENCIGVSVSRERGFYE